MEVRKEDLATPKPLTPTQRRAIEVQQEHAEAQRAKPDFEALKSAFGKKRVRFERDSTKFTIDLKPGDRRDAEILRDLRKPYAEKMTRVSNKRSEANQTVLARNPEGQLVRIPVEHEADAGRRGMRNVVTGKRRRITSDTEIRRQMEEAARA